MFTICVFICNDPATTEIYSYRHTLSLHDALPICWASQALQPRAAVQGNLNPVFLVTGGEPMIRAADAIVDALGGGPFVFNLGHGVQQRTPPEHVAALIRHLRGDRRA